MTQVGGKLVDGRFEQGGILARGLGVVNGAGAGQDEQARSRAVENVADFVAGVEDGRRGGFGDGTLFLEKNRGKDDLRPLDADVFRGVEHAGFLAVCSSRNLYQDSV